MLAQALLPCDGGSDGCVPAAPGTLYAGTASAGVFKSSNAGATWLSVSGGLPAQVFALALDPAAPTTLYAGTQGDAGL